VLDHFGSVDLDALAAALNAVGPQTAP